MFYPWVEHELVSDEHECLAEEVSEQSMGSAAWFLLAAYQRVQKGKSLEPCFYEPRNSEDCHKPQEARNQPGRPSPGPSETA